MLYLVTNRQLIKSGSLLTVIDNAVRGGLDAVILREKDLSASRLYTLALGVNKVLKGTKVRFIVNGNLTVLVLFRQMDTIRDLVLLTRPENTAMACRVFQYIRWKKLLTLRNGGRITC